MTQVCGMQEFSAPPGVAHVPYHVMESLGIKEGTNVEFELATPVDGTYVKFRLHMLNLCYKLMLSHLNLVLIS